MGLSKFIRELAKSVPTAKPIIQTFEEIVRSLQRNFPLAKSKDLKQEVLNAKHAYNKKVADMKRAYDKEITGGFDNPWEKLIEDCSSLNKPQNPPHPGGGPLGGGNNPGRGGGPMLGGGGWNPLWPK